jgi:hypothetical protein
MIHVVLSIYYAKLRLSKWLPGGRLLLASMRILRGKNILERVQGILGVELLSPWFRDPFMNGVRYKHVNPPLWQGRVFEHN